MEIDYAYKLAKVTSETYCNFDSPYTLSTFPNEFLNRNSPNRENKNRRIYLLVDLPSAAQS